MAHVPRPHILLIILVRVSPPPAGPHAATDFMVDNLTVATVPALTIQLSAGSAVKLAG
jgi:hypothetical protein